MTASTEESLLPGFEELIEVAGSLDDATPAPLSVLARAALRRLIDNACAAMESIQKAQLGATCAFCIPVPTTYEHTKKVADMTAHMSTCAEHPHSKVLAALREARRTLLDWNASGVEPAHLDSTLDLISGVDGRCGGGS